MNAAELASKVGSLLAAANKGGRLSGVDRYAQLHDSKAMLAAANIARATSRTRAPRNLTEGGVG